jgi:hypothetical protein
MSISRLCKPIAQRRTLEMRTPLAIEFTFIPDQVGLTKVR